jgi:hypothetical protein
MEKTPEVVHLTTVYGPIIVAFVSATRIYVEVGDENGRAHNNDRQPALVYRNGEYIGPVWFTRPNTTINVWNTESSLSRRYGKSAARTYAAAMEKAIWATVQAHIDAHPEILMIGEVVHLSIRIERATADRDKAAAELDKAESALSLLRSRLFAAQGGTPKPADDAARSEYRRREIDAVLAESSGEYRVKVRADNAETKWLSVDRDEVVKIGEAIGRGVKS